MGKKIRYLLIFLCVEYHENSAFEHKFHRHLLYKMRIDGSGKEKHAIKQDNIRNIGFIKDFFVARTLLSLKHTM